MQPNGSHGDLDDVVETLTIVHNSFLQILKSKDNSPYNMFHHSDNLHLNCQHLQNKKLKTILNFLFIS